MQIQFLGTSSGMPTRERNVTSVAVRPMQSTEWLLLDCGEGTQHQILRSDLVKLSRIRKVFLTHLHADHVAGLPGLLASRGLHGIRDPLTVFGPGGTSEFVTSVLTMTDTHLPFPIDSHCVSPGIVVRDPRYAVSCSLLEHRTSTFGYRIEEPDRPGPLDAAAAQAQGVPKGPLLGRLKRGETVVLDNGRAVSGQELRGPTQRGQSLVFCTDTAPCDAAVELARDADLLVHEATFGDEEFQRAAEHGHSTATQAAEIADRAGVGRLILTHFSARYGGPRSEAIQRLVSEARSVFPRTDAAEDFMTVDLGRDR